MKTFNGFSEPKENWTKLPNEFIEELPEINSMSELKCILYILRHTWGFHDEQKKLTTDEFMNGRKRRDGTRMDSGTGLSKNSIISGLKSAEEHGFIEVDLDKRDMARMKKTFRLKMK